MGKYHNILYVALKIAWNWDVKDSAVICALLSMNISQNQLICDCIVLNFVSAEIYECEKTFERLFLGAIFGSSAPYFIAGWRSDFKDQVNEIIINIFMFVDKRYYSFTFDLHNRTKILVLSSFFYITHVGTDWCLRLMATKSRKMNKFHAVLFVSIVIYVSYFFL